MSRTPLSMREAIWIWLQKALEVIVEQQVPVRLEWDLDVSDNGVGGTSRAVPDIRAWVYNSVPILTRLHETETVVVAIREVHQAAESFVNESEPNSTLDRTTITRDCLAPIAVEVLIRGAQSRRTTEDHFHEIYEQLEAFIFEYETLKFRWVIHLSAVKSRVDVVELSDTVRVRRATLEEQGRAFTANTGDELRSHIHQSDTPRLPSRHDPHSVPYVVVEIQDQHRLPRRRPDWESARTIGRRVIEAMRLTDKGAVNGHTIWREDGCPFMAGERTIEWFDTGALRSKSYPEYVLTPEGEELLKSIWPVVDFPRQADPLGLARQRLQYSGESSFVANPILDCWIGLEALFLIDGSGELSFRAAHRIARYLGETPEERLSLAKRATSSYNVRSMIAHGNVKSLRKITVEKRQEAIDSSGELLRRAIRKALLDGQPPDGKALDQAMLS